MGENHDPATAQIGSVQINTQLSVELFAAWSCVWGFFGRVFLVWGVFFSFCVKLVSKLQQFSQCLFWVLQQRINLSGS